LKDDPNPNPGLAALNNELQQINNWLKANKLSLNIDKTCFKIFYNQNKKITKFNLKIDGVEIKSLSFQFSWDYLT
jgi:hypothetical protein